ncbi:hypothetical protein Pmar_PMAR028346, partial [Perkinsus marinus ATCC 50983]
DNVPETIADLHQAGIKVWVLTGDKIETAINIAYSSKLLYPTVLNEVITSTNPHSIHTALDALAQTIQGGSRNEEEDGGVVVRIPLALESSIDLCVKDSLTPTPSSWITAVAITISGDSLAVVLKDRDLRKKFFKFALSHCITIIACRVSPKQKAQIVKWSGSYLPSNTMLAIGDGANDVGMIVSADVGVGINGKEGAQAARSADYAIPQFHCLRRLLFLHGRESIRKNSTFIYYTVFKNVAFSLPAFLLGLVSQFSGTSLYDPILKQGYNVIFTLLPILLYVYSIDSFLLYHT